MKTLSVTICDHRGIKQTEMVDLRMAAIIMRLLDEQEYIRQWPRGKAEVHWNDEKIIVNLTKRDSS